MKKLYLSYEFRRRMKIAAGLYPGKSTKNDFTIKVNGVNHKVTFSGYILTIEGPNPRILGNVLKTEFSEISMNYLGSTYFEENDIKDTYELFPEY